MELALYAILIRISLVLINFLKSFYEDQQLKDEELQVIKQGRTVFKVVTINICVMAFTNSVFSAISPYLWLGDVYSRNNFFISCFFICTTIFYLANSFFACLLLYVIHKFGLDQQGNFRVNRTKSSVTESSQIESTRQYSRVSPYLNISEPDYMGRAMSVDTPNHQNKTSTVDQSSLLKG